MPSVLKKLVKAGKIEDLKKSLTRADINAPNAPNEVNDAFIEAAACGCETSMQILLDHGADLQHVVEKAEEGFKSAPLGEKAMEEAARFGRVEVIKYLIAKEVMPPRDAFVAAIQRRKWDVVRFFIAEGLDIDENLVVCAAAYGAMDVLREAVKKEIDLTIQHGMVLHQAVAHGQEEATRFLLAHGAGWPRKNDTCCRVAASMGYFNIVEIFLDEGCDIHMEDDLVLRRAFREHGDISAIKMLLSRGADIHALNGWILKNLPNFLRPCRELAVGWVKLTEYYGPAYENEKIMINKAFEEGQPTADVLGKKITEKDENLFSLIVKTGYLENLDPVLIQRIDVDTLTAKTTYGWSAINWLIEKEKLSDFMKPDIWVGRTRDFQRFWTNIPQDARRGFDFQDIVSRINRQSVRARLRPARHG